MNIATTITTTIHEPAQRTFSTVHEIKVFVFVVFFNPFQKKKCVSFHFDLPP